MSRDRLGSQVKLVSSLTRSGSSRGQSDSIVNAIRLRLEDADYRVGGAAVAYEDLDGGSEERGSWDSERERANARYAAGDPDVVAYIATLDTDVAPYSIPITNEGAAQWAHELGAKRIAVLHDGEPCGRGVAEPFGRSCLALGLELVELPVAIAPSRTIPRARGESRSACAGSGLLRRNHPERGRAALA